MREQSGGAHGQASRQIRPIDERPWLAEIPDEETEPRELARFHMTSQPQAPTGRGEDHNTDLPRRTSAFAGRSKGLPLLASGALLYSMQRTSLDHEASGFSRSSTLQGSR